MNAKRGWSIALILVLILGMVPFRSRAASDEYGGDIWESDLRWTFTGGDTLTISGIGEMPDFESGTPWYEHTDAIVHLVIEQGVTNIGASAFKGCTALESVSLPEGLEQIGSSAFAYCRNLAEVVIPDTVETIGADAFYDCTALRNVALPSKVQYIGSSAFNGCSLSGRISIPATVTELGAMAFGRCYEIEAYSVAADNPVYASDKEGVIYTKDGTKLIEAPALMDCGSYTVPEGVTEIEAGAFGFCKWMYKVNLPQSLKTIWSSAFYGCSDLVEVQLPQNLTTLGMAVFYGCSSLREIAIPGQVRCVDTHVFRECTNLKTVTVLGANTIIDPMAFVGCTKLERVEISEKSTRYSNDAQGLLYNKEKTELVFVPLAKSGELELPKTVEKIGLRAVQNCRNLTKVTIPETVTEIGYGAFWNCVSLQDVYFEGDAPKIGYSAFQYEFTTEDGEKKTENIPGLTLYYLAGKTGWTSPIWEGYPTQCHVHNNTDTVKAPTCTEKGYTTHVCKDCGTVSTDQYVDPLGHDYKAETKAATCTAEGYTTHICTRCGDRYVDGRTQALGHDFRKGVCTRCGAKDPNWGTRKNPFVDVGQKDYYYDAVLWAADRGITSGVDASHFAPNGTCTRAQVVCFLYRYQGNPGHGTGNPFRDVKSGSYYYDAVLWAAENGVVYGTDTTHFSPDKTCTRGQVVCFLYRLLG